MISILSQSVFLGALSCTILFWKVSESKGSAQQSLSHRERLGLWSLLGIMVLLGFVVERRTAFLERRMGDLTVYLRAAWAVRSGQDVYQIVDHNGWHYHYPLLFAIMMTPLAEPPAGVVGHGVLPFPVTVAVCYVANLLFLMAGIHMLASALERTSTEMAVRKQSPGCRRWWILRALPLLACFPPIKVTLLRGQVNLLLLMLLCGMSAAILRGRRGQAGWWLAGAICLKLIPLYLLLYPLWRRDRRFLQGCALGLIVGMGVIPTLVFGPWRTAAYYQEWGRVLLLPALGKATDHSRDDELLAMTATDNQSFLCAVHNTFYLNRSRELRPGEAAPGLRVAHWALGAVLTLVTIAVTGHRDEQRAGNEVLRLGALVLLMLLLSPVCHLHYFCLALPLMLVLLERSWHQHYAGQEENNLRLLFAVFMIANALPLVQGLEILSDVGLAMYATLAVWLAAILTLTNRCGCKGMPLDGMPAPS